MLCIVAGPSRNMAFDLASMMPCSTSQYNCAVFHAAERRPRGRVDLHVLVLEELDSKHETEAHRSAHALTCVQGMVRYPCTGFVRRVAELPCLLYAASIGVGNSICNSRIRSAHQQTHEYRACVQRGCEVYMSPFNLHKISRTSRLWRRGIEG